ncbi:MAG: hypothetical protein ABIN24_12840 [Dyadobacter sp.]
MDTVSHFLIMIPPIDDLKKENFAQGWAEIIGKTLKEFLKKQQYNEMANSFTN